MAKVIFVRNTRRERAAVQQNKPGRYFSDTQPQQPVYRFPQNRPGYRQQEVDNNSRKLSKRDRRAADRAHRRSRKRVFTLWNLFAVIGIVTVIVQTVRYVIIPLLVYLNVLAGGAL